MAVRGLSLSCGEQSGWPVAGAYRLGTALVRGWGLSRLNLATRAFALKASGSAVHFSGL